MDIISAFKSELFRPLVTLFIPGGVAAAPYFLLLGHYHLGAQKFWDDHPSTATAVVIGCIVAVGLILENLGSRVEEQWDSILNWKTNGEHNATWDAYLGLKMRDEIVGQRYLRTVLIRMKFELGMVPACAFAMLGAIWLDRVEPFWPFDKYWLWVGGISLLVYFTLESLSSARLMGRTRGIVVNAVRGRSNHAFE